MVATSETGVRGELQMIDMIVNDRTGAYVVHDEREMDRVERLEICSRSGVASLLLSGGTCRRLGSLAPTLVSALKEKRPEGAMLVRQSGGSSARATRDKREARCGGKACVTRWKSRGSLY